MFGLEKFYKFIYGQKVLVYTDHKPLLGVIKNGNTTFAVTTRVQRYLLSLNIFDFDVHYRPGKFNAIADFPPRFPNKDTLLTGEDAEEAERVSIINCVHDGTTLNIERIREETVKDPLLSKLCEALLRIKQLVGELKVFSAVKDALNEVSGVVTVEGR